MTTRFLRSAFAGALALALSPLTPALAGSSSKNEDLTLYCHYKGEIYEIGTTICVQKKKNIGRLQTCEAREKGGMEKKPKWVKSKQECAYEAGANNSGGGSDASSDYGDDEY